MIQASCHCGAVQLTLSRAPQTVTECNCSICRRLGVRWAYYPPDQVTIDKAEGATAPYAWGDKVIAFHHCVTCGCTTHHEGISPRAKDHIAVNARLMAPGVVANVRVRHFDGAKTWTYLDE